jgi:sugar lactone lactonase YvrE
MAGLAGMLGNSDGTGAAARFNFPFGIATDSSGNIFVTDTVNDTVRKIQAGGVVTTWAGASNNPGSSDGNGEDARFFRPGRIATDRAGNVYVPDTRNHTIRKITPAGLTTTFAGRAGQKGSVDGESTIARFAYPRAVAVDSLGNVYVADSGNCTIRKITPSGEVSTLAGQAGVSGSKDGIATAALFTDPTGISADLSGNVYVSDDIEHVIRKITADGRVSAFAGSNGNAGYIDGAGSIARFTSPGGLTVDGAGNLYVADAGNNTIRKITPDGMVSTVAGKASTGSADGSASEATFATLDGLAVDASGAVYIADTSNHTIRKISPSGDVSTVAGMAGVAGSSDGFRSEARFNNPETVAVDPQGNVYVPDASNHTIRKIAADGAVTTLAGLAGSYGSTDGFGSQARFFYPFGLALDKGGNIYVADGYNHIIRKITPAGLVSTLAGLAGQAGDQDGVASAARFKAPESVTVDSSGNVYVADFGNHTIRKILPNGTVSTLAGLAGFSGDADGLGPSARFSNPASIAVDLEANVYVADAYNNKIRMITPAGVVSTLAGSLTSSAGSSDGLGNAARFRTPFGIAVDDAGNLYVSDSGNNTIRKGLSFAITTQPQSKSVNADGTVQFTVTVDALASVSYQWRQNGQDLVGATNATLSLSRVKRSQAGKYSVRIANSGGSLLSADAILDVISSTLPPNLAAYQPAGWADKIVISSRGASSIEEGPLYANQPIYLDWAVKNTSLISDVAKSFAVVLYVDDQPKNTWLIDRLDAEGVKEVQDYNIGPVAIGLHSIRLEIDSRAEIVEQDETDNIVSMTIVVISPPKAAQTISFDLLIGRIFGDAPFAVNAAASSGLPVTFNMVSGPANLSGNIVTLSGVGAVTIAATQVGNDDYLPAVEVRQTFSVIKSSQVINFGALEDKRFGNAPFMLAAQASAGLPVSFNVVSGPATFADGRLALTGAGTVIVRATQAGDERYAAAPSVERAFNVLKAAQTLVFAPLAARSFTDGPLQVEATASSGLPVSFAMVSGPATLSGNVLIVSGAGTVIVRASQTGDANYEAAAHVDQTLTVNQAAQSISFTSLASKVFGDPPFSLQAAASSGMPVTFAIVDGPAVMNQDMVAITGAGRITIRASQTGNDNYAAAPAVEQTFEVAKASQSITFGPLGDRTFGDAPFQLSGSASSSLPVSWTIVSGPAALLADVITLTGSGTVIVRASQPGDANHQAAPDLERSFRVVRSGVSIEFSPRDGISLSFEAEVGRTYVLEGSHDLAVWTAVKEQSSSTGQLKITDSNAPSSRLRFYRIRAK